MKTEIFNNLLANLKRNTSELDEEAVVLIANYNQYTINIYGEIENNYELIVEESGYVDRNKEWHNVELTEMQKQILKTILDIEVESVKQNIIQEENEQRNDDGYDEYEPYRSMFSTYYGI